MDRPLRDALPRAFLIRVTPSAFDIVPHVVRLELIDALYGQPLENRRQGQVCPQGVFLAAIRQKPLHVFVGEFCQRWTPPIPILDAEFDVSLHSFFGCSAFGLGLCFGGDADFLPTVAKPGVPDYFSVGFMSFPWHA